MLISFMMVMALASDPGDSVDLADGEKSYDVGATTDGIREILTEVWNAAPDKAKRTGNAILSRYRRQKADKTALQYAYGVALVKHQDWVAAETNFRTVADHLKTSPEAWLALGHVHLRMGKVPDAISDLRRAYECAPEDDAVLETLGKTLTFLSMNPPPKSKPQMARDLEDDVKPTLKGDNAKTYDDAVAEMKDYIAKIPELRTKLLEPVEGSRQELGDIQRELASMQVQYRKGVTEYRQRQSNLAQISAAASSALVQYDRQIQDAIKRGDLVRAQTYQAQKNANEQLYAARAQEEQIRLSSIESSMVALESEVAERSYTAQSLKQEVDSATQQVEQQLMMAPPVWDAADERQRLLDDGFPDPRVVAGQQPKAKRAKGEKKPSSEEQARIILHMADSFRSSGMPQMAKKYFQRVIEEYPNTVAAKDADWELEQAEKQIADDKQKAAESKSAETDEERPKSSRRKRRDT